MAKIKESPEVFKAKLLDAVNEYFSAAEQDSPALGLSDIANKVGVNLNSTISEMKSDTYVQRNSKLMSILEQYESAIHQGAYEERLYETFIHSVSPYASYMTGLTMPLKSLKDRVENSKVEVDLTKILESMLETTSYYIVPLIEENVATYVREKTPNHRVQLMSNLAAFAGDPYVKLMIEAINLDNDRTSGCCSESKVISAVDKIKFIHENAEIKSIYSPIQYLKENKCVFSANGRFYTKNGANISKFDIAHDGAALTESFVHLSRLVNDPRVSINGNNITFASNNKIVSINESGVEINGKKESPESFGNINALAIMYEDYDLNFWAEAKLLVENFNNIAEVDFAKHVDLYDNKNLSFDLMKIGENLYVTTHNDSLNEHIFYKNVNPIQCRNVINEHMGMNVSDLFENLLPNQDMLMKKIYETANAYEEAISKYSAQLDKLNSAKDKAEGDQKSKLEKMMSDIKDKKEDLEKEYKEFQDKSKDLTQKDEDDEEGKKIEKSADPIKSSEVDDVKDELSQPISDDYDEEIDEPEGDDDLDNSQAKHGFVSDDDMNDAIADVVKSNYSDESDIEGEDTNGAYDINDDADSYFDDAESYEESQGFEDMEDNGTVLEDDDKCTRVIDIAFNQNVLDKTVQRSGTAYVSIPMLDGQGNLKKEIKLFNFNVNPDGVITMENNNEDISYDLYNTVVSAIESHPDYSEMSDVESSADNDENLPDDIEMEVGDDDEIGSEFDAEFDDTPEANIDDFEDETEAYNDQDASADAVKTYVKDGTEIEMPADDTDPSKIRESLRTRPQKSYLNEEKYRKLFDDDNVLEDDEDLPEVEEEIPAISSDDMLGVMHDSFVTAAEAASEDDVDVEVSGPETLDIEIEDAAEGEDDVITVDYFTVSGINEAIDEDDEFEDDEDFDDESSYVIYRINDEIYSRPESEFEDIIDSYEGAELANALKSEHVDSEEMGEPLNPVGPEDEDACVDILTMVMNNVAGDSYGVEDAAVEAIESLKGESDADEDEFEIPEEDEEDEEEDMDEGCIYESIKIRRKNGLKATETNDSKKDAEAEDPTESKEEKHADDKKEEAQKEAEEKANEAYKPKNLPNQKKMSMTAEAFHARGEEWFNVNDKVIYKPLKNTSGVIYSVESDGTYDILLNDGTKVYGVKANQLQPKDLSTKDIGYLDIPQTDLSKPKDSDYKDLNKRADANIVVDGYKMNNESYSVSLNDVYSKKQYLRVMNESGEVDRYPRENVEVCDVPEEDWKWAVFTMDSDLEPDRKIQVDPCSWNRAASVCDSDPDCLVKCLKAGEVVELPYKYIKFIA